MAKNEVPGIVAIWRYMKSNAINGIWTGRIKEIRAATGYADGTISRSFTDMNDSGAIEYIERGTFGAPSKIRPVSVPTPIRSDVWTVEAKAQFKIMWERGDTREMLESHFGVSKNAIGGQRQRMGLEPRPAPIRKNVDGTYSRVYLANPTGINTHFPELPAVQVSRRLAGLPNVEHKAVPLAKPIVFGVRKKKSPLPETVRHLPHTAGNRGPSGRGVSALTLRGLTGLTSHLPELPPARQGSCRWPLRCGDNAELGNWCAHHAGLLGKRVTVRDRREDVG